ncbi:MAG TPA: Ig domain-containing protein [Thermoleophilaceae bacterium]|nr:Ig domain-containing protein [Thermoleophilaceae bacterium]
MFSSICSETLGRRTFLTLASGVIMACLLGLTASAATAATVTNAGDAGPGSLRAVIAAADDGDTIVFDASLDGETIDLTSGEIAIDKSLAIEGPGPSQLTIDAGHDSRIFTLVDVNLPIAVSISGLTLANGMAPDRPAAPDRGGAIEQASDGPLTISDMTFSGNASGGAGGDGQGSGFGNGGAIHVSAWSGATSISDSTFVANTAGGPGGVGLNSGRGSGGAINDDGGGTLTISGSTFTANRAGGHGGGGIDSGAASGGALSVAGGGGQLTISDSTFEANSAGGDGGAGSNSGDALGGALEIGLGPHVISGSTFTGNRAGGDSGTGASSADGRGGAIYATGSLSVSNSTLVSNATGGDNSDGSGGAIMSTGSAILTNVTISGNSASEEGEGAGIYGDNPLGVQVAEVTARATIVAGNTGAENCNLPVESSSYSIEGPSSSDTSCGFSRPSADPLLATLADNGGPTETRALQPSSPAVDVVPLAQCPTSTDQRGEPRPEPGAAFCDIGAFERQDPVAPTITSGAAATFQVGTNGSFTIVAKGGPTPSLSQTGELPSGMSFTDNGDGTGSLAGTPATGTDGVYPIAFEASNGTSPDAVQSFTLTVKPAPPIPITDPPPGDPPPDGPTDPGPPSTPRPPLALQLTGGEGRTLRKLLRTGKLVVAARVNEAARVTLTGRARLRVQTRSRATTRLIRVFKIKTTRFSAAGKKRVTLVLTRKGQKALRDLDEVRLVIAGKAVDATGQRAPLDRRVLDLS